MCIDLTEHGFRIHKYTGEFIICQRAPPGDPMAPVFNGHRGELHECVFDYARDECGIPIHLNHRIQKYVEDEKEAGIILESGEKVGLRFVCIKQGVADSVTGHCGRGDWIRWSEIQGSRACPGIR